jgi:hypothetical protein
VTINCHKMQVKDGRGAGEAEQSRTGCGGVRRSGSGERVGRKKGEGGADRRAPGVSGSKKKKKKKGRRAAAGEVKWAVGLLGRKVR